MNGYGNCPKVSRKEIKKLIKKDRIKQLNRIANKKFKDINPFEELSHSDSS